jgi:hypothetical protein
MSTLDDLHKQLGSVSQAEKAQLLQWVVGGQDVRVNRPAR